MQGLGPLAQTTALLNVANQSKVEVFRRSGHASDGKLRFVEPDVDGVGRRASTSGAAGRIGSIPTSTCVGDVNVGHAPLARKRPTLTPASTPRPPGAQAAPKWKRTVRSHGSEPDDASTT